MARDNAVKRLIKKLEEGQKGQEAEIEELIKLNSKNILDLNKQQLFKGQDSTGKSLGKYKSKWYAAFKRMLNPLGVVDLYLSGRFYSQFFIKRFKFPVQIDSKDEKTSALVARWGKNIFGLNEESRKIFAKDILKVGLKKYWRRVLGLR